jgi:dynein heavy chain
MTILKKFYTINIIKEKFKLCNIEEYRFPKGFEYPVFLDYTNQLPFDDSPEVFGMHPFANISYQNQEA